MYFGSYTFITEHILVLRILYLHYRAYSCISDTEVPVGTTEHFTCTKVPIGTTEQIHHTEVLVGTTRLILILQNLYLFYRYGSTRRYYKDFTYTKVPVGTTEHIQRYP